MCIDIYIYVPELLALPSPQARLRVSHPLWFGWGSGCVIMHAYACIGMHMCACACIGMHMHA